MEPWERADSRGTARTADEKTALGDLARQLRAEGRSVRAIRADLRIGDELVRTLLRGVPVRESLRRPRATDARREVAVTLREAGLTYDAIAAELGVSKSTCSVWLRGLPRSGDAPQVAADARERRTAALRERARRDRQLREQASARLADAAATSLGVVTSHDLVVALAVSYWCEGAKRKPWARSPSFRWMNSDPALVTLFLDGLGVLGIARDRLVLRLHIHASADEVEAREWWSRHTGVPLDQFRRSTIKRHQPRKAHRAVAGGYRGCLAVSVLRGRDLYDVLEGLVTGLATQPRCDGEWHHEVSSAPPSACP